MPKPVSAAIWVVPVVLVVIGWYSMYYVYYSTTLGVIAVTMAMVTARVDAERKREAEMVLKRHGLTYSDVIRDLTNYLADTGELPEFERITLDLVRRREMERKLAIIEMFANAELPAVEGDWSDEEIVEQERLRKAGEPW